MQDLGGRPEQDHYITASSITLLDLRDLCCPTPGTRGRSSLRSSEQGLLFVPFARRGDLAPVILIFEFS